MTRFQRASLLIAALVTLVAFGVGLPALSAQGPATRHLDGDTVVGTTYGAVTMPGGWDLDIAAAAQSQPTATQGGARVVVADGVWLEDSAHLLRNVASLVFDAAPALPDAPTDDGTISSLTDAASGGAPADPVRLQWRLEAPQGATEDDPRYVDVVRYGELVILVIVRGDADAVAQRRDALEAVTASVTFDAAGPSVGSGS